MVGGVSVGIVQAMAGGYISTEAETAIVYAVLLAVIVVRPYGLFGTREIIRA